MQIRTTTGRPGGKGMAFGGLVLLSMNLSLVGCSRDVVMLNPRTGDTAVCPASPLNPWSSSKPAWETMSLRGGSDKNDPLDCRRPHGRMGRGARGPGRDHCLGRGRHPVPPVFPTERTASASYVGAKLIRRTGGQRRAMRILVVED